MKRALRWSCLCLAVLGAGLLGGLIQASQAGKENNESDQELNAAYQKVLALVTDPEDRRLLVEAQKSWIKFRDANVAFHGHYFPASKGGLFVNTDMTRDRTKELKSLLTPEAKAEHHPF